jgi:hypothetical protein
LNILTIMRISSIWALLGLTSANDLPGPVAEILAQSMTKQFLEDVLGSQAILGRRTRRQADCTDENDNCTQFKEYCSNNQFLIVCKETCNACGDNGLESAAAPAAPTEVGKCHDSMTYCGAMGQYCENPDYAGVRMYCKKTCNSCDEDFSDVTDGPAADQTGDACAEKDYCAQFSYCAGSQLLKDRMENECPVQCKAPKCKHIWEKIPDKPKSKEKTSSGVLNLKCILKLEKVSELPASLFSLFID